MMLRVTSFLEFNNTDLCPGTCVDVKDLCCLSSVKRAPVWVAWTQMTHYCWKVPLNLLDSTNLTFVVVQVCDPKMDSSLESRIITDLPSVKRTSKHGICVDSRCELLGLK